jgi:RimJ/RimL family protein N-acetyltransferase
VTSFPQDELLPDDVLALRETLPLKPAPVSLEGRFVRLRPLDLLRDRDVLHAVSNGSPASLGDRRVAEYDPDTLVWRYLFDGSFATAAHLGDFLQGLIDMPNMLPFCVFDAETDTQVGVAAYTNNTPEHLKIELGHIWYSPLVQRSHANVETAYLLLKHAFGLGYRRVEWKCDALNERSRRSALSIGFQFEGIQQAHFIIKGRNRDTAWFRMLDHEWPAVREKLEKRLYGGG